MSAETTIEEVRDLEEEIISKSQRLAELKRSLPPLTVDDYELKRSSGGVRLSELFAGKRDLIVIHNMG
ncbi:MAG: DUF899 family protein, partial [Verrucomicrobiales bacterium]